MNYVFETDNLGIDIQKMLSTGKYINECRRSSEAVKRVTLLTCGTRPTGDGLVAKVRGAEADVFVF